jgi:hypothetical protein
MEILLLPGIRDADVHELAPRSGKNTGEAVEVLLFRLRTDGSVTHSPGDSKAR